MSSVVGTLESVRLTSGEPVGDSAVASVDGLLDPSSSAGNVGDQFDRVGPVDVGAREQVKSDDSGTSTRGAGRSATDVFGAANQAIGSRSAGAVTKSATGCAICGSTSGCMCHLLQQDRVSTDDFESTVDAAKLSAAGREAAGAKVLGGDEAAPSSATTRDVSRSAEELVQLSNQRLTSGRDDAQPLPSRIADNADATARRPSIEEQSQRPADRTPSADPAKDPTASNSKTVADRPVMNPGRPETADTPVSGLDRPVDGAAARQSAELREAQLTAEARDLALGTAPQPSTGAADRAGATLGQTVAQVAPTLADRVEINARPLVDGALRPSDGQPFAQTQERSVDPSGAASQSLGVATESLVGESRALSTGPAAAFAPTAPAPGTLGAATAQSIPIATDSGVASAKTTNMVSAGFVTEGAASQTAVALPPSFGLSIGQGLRGLGLSEGAVEAAVKDIRAMVAAQTDRTGAPLSSESMRGLCVSIEESGVLSSRLGVLGLMDVLRSGQSIEGTSPAALARLCERVGRALERQESEVQARMNEFGWLGLLGGRQARNANLKGSNVDLLARELMGEIHETLGQPLEEEAHPDADSGDGRQSHDEEADEHLDDEYESLARRYRRRAARALRQRV
ncbi:MAG: hypothetical protein AAF654_08180 [Myxococcota bacterium]